jgi:DNA-binding MarR family transcriptional regulator
MHDPQADTDSVSQLSAVLKPLLAADFHGSIDTTFRVLHQAAFSMSCLVVLNVVEQCGMASISQISMQLGFSLGNTSSIVDKLVGTGFVTRAEDTLDRRQKVVQLTSKGQELLEHLQTLRANQIAERLLLLPPALLERTITLLRDIKACNHTGS